MSEMNGDSKPMRMQRFTKSELNVGMTNALVRNICLLAKKYYCLTLGFIYFQEN